MNRLFLFMYALMSLGIANLTHAGGDAHRICKINVSQVMQDNKALQSAMQHLEKVQRKEFSKMDAERKKIKNDKKKMTAYEQKALARSQELKGISGLTMNNFFKHINNAVEKTAFIKKNKKYSACVFYIYGRPYSFATPNAKNSKVNSLSQSVMDKIYKKISKKSYKVSKAEIKKQLDKALEQSLAMVQAQKNSKK